MTQAISQPLPPRFPVVDNMRRYGGNFVYKLADAIVASDPKNYSRICAAFPDVIAKYSETDETSTSFTRRAKNIQIIVNGREVTSSHSKLEAIKTLLEQMNEQEQKCHIMDSTIGLCDMLDEVIESIDRFIDNDPSDADLMGGPPLSASEISVNALTEHLEAHS